MGGIGGRFNEAAEYHRCIRDSTKTRQIPGLQLIAAVYADLSVALGEADTVHLSSLWKRRSEGLLVPQ